MHTNRDEVAMEIDNDMPALERVTSLTAQPTAAAPASVPSKPSYQSHTFKTKPPPPPPPPVLTAAGSRGRRVLSAQQVASMRHHHAAAAPVTTSASAASAAATSTPVAAVSYSTPSPSPPPSSSSSSSSSSPHPTSILIDVTPSPDENDGDDIASVTSAGGKAIAAATTPQAVTAPMSGTASVVVPPTFSRDASLNTASLSTPANAAPAPTPIITTVSTSADESNRTSHTDPPPASSLTSPRTSVVSPASHPQSRFQYGDSSTISASSTGSNSNVNGMNHPHPLSHSSVRGKHWSDPQFNSECDALLAALTIEPHAHLAPQQCADVHATVERLVQVMMSQCSREARRSRVLELLLSLQHRFILSILALDTNFLKTCYHWMHQFCRELQKEARHGGGRVECIVRVLYQLLGFLANVLPPTIPLIHALHADHIRRSLPPHLSSYHNPSRLSDAQQHMTNITNYLQSDFSRECAHVGQEAEGLRTVTNIFLNKLNTFDALKWWVDTIELITHTVTSNDMPMAVSPSSNSPSPTSPRPAAAAASSNLENDSPTDASDAVRFGERLLSKKHIDGRMIGHDHEQDMDHGRTPASSTSGSNGVVEKDDDDDTSMTGSTLDVNNASSSQGLNVNGSLGLKRKRFRLLPGGKPGSGPMQHDPFAVLPTTPPSILCQRSESGSLLPPPPRPLPPKSTLSDAVACSTRSACTNILLGRMQDKYAFSSQTVAAIIRGEIPPLDEWLPKEPESDAIPVASPGSTIVTALTRTFLFRLTPLLIHSAPSLLSSWSLLIAQLVRLCEATFNADRFMSNDHMRRLLQERALRRLIGRNWNDKEVKERDVNMERMIHYLRTGEEQDDKQNENENEHDIGNQTDNRDDATEQPTSKRQRTNDQQQKGVNAAPSSNGNSPHKRSSSPNSPTLPTSRLPTPRSSSSTSAPTRPHVSIPPKQPMTGSDRDKSAVAPSSSPPSTPPRGLSPQARFKPGDTAQDARRAVQAIQARNGNHKQHRDRDRDKERDMGRDNGRDWDRNRGKDWDHRNPSSSHPSSRGGNGNDNGNGNMQGNDVRQQQVRPASRSGHANTNAPNGYRYQSNRPPAAAAARPYDEASSRRVRESGPMNMHRHAPFPPR